MALINSNNKNSYADERILFDFSNRYSEIIKNNKTSDEHYSQIFSILRE